MPLYDYVCKSCGYEFEEFHSIENRDKPTKEFSRSDCSAGESTVCDISLKLGAPSLGDPIKLGIRKTDDAFKDRLKDIKKRHRGSTINV